MEFFYDFGEALKLTLKNELQGNLKNEMEFELETMNWVNQKINCK